MGVDPSDGSRDEQVLRDDVLLRAIVEGTDDAIYAKDTHGVIISWNPGAERLYGYRAEDAIGRHVSMIVPDDRRGEERRILDQVLAGDRVDHYRTARRRADGSLVDVSLMVSAVHDHDGNVVAASVIARDISQVVELEALRKANELKDYFVAFVAHEFRTPMTSIAGFTDTLLDQWQQTADSDKRRYLTVISDQTARLSKLIEDLLTLSAIDASADRLHVEPVRIVESIDAALAELGRSDIAVRGERDVVALGSDHHVRQMLINLVSNAMKYGREPIEVSVEAIDEGVRLVVRDRGDGVPDQYRPYLFERFARPELRNASVSGTGLGLSIVDGLARAYGGAVDYSHDTRGTSFAVTLPQATPA